MQNSSSGGSVEVEAALILPLTILVIVGMMRLSTTLYEKTAAASLENSRAAQELVEGGALPTESILRGRWYLK